MKIISDTEKWEKWIPEDNLFSTFCINKILIDTKALYLTLSNTTDPEKKIKVVDDGSLFSYRVTQRTNFKIVSQKNKKFDESWSLFIVENSEYLEWLKEESYGVYENEKEQFKMKHFVFVGSNVVVEILSPGAPEFIL